MHRASIVVVSFTRTGRRATAALGPPRGRAESPVAHYLETRLQPGRGVEESAAPAQVEFGVDFEEEEEAVANGYADEDVLELGRVHEPVGE